MQKIFYLGYADYFFNMDKLTRYNQKILAVLGTLAIVALVVILIISTTAWIISLVASNKIVDNTLQVADNQNPQQKDNKTRQLVSYLEPELADSLNNIYIIPVTQRTLEHPVDDARLAKEKMLDLNSLGSYSNDYAYGDGGSYNNIIIYQKNRALKKPLFDFRINIIRFYVNKINDQAYLFVVGTKGDTDKDGTYSNDDLLNLYLYDLEGDYLKTISVDNATYMDAQNLYKTDDMVLSFGMDINRDGSFDVSREPKRLKLYSITADELSDFITPEMHRAIQKMVD